MRFQGRVWKLGDNINTDVLLPGHTLGMPLTERKRYCLQAVRPEFAASVSPGDVIVAGRNFGCGSARPASEVLLELGVGGVVAESFSPIFFRNAVAAGLPVAEVPGVGGHVVEGDRVTVDLREGVLINERDGTTVSATRLPEELLRILAAGGIVNVLRQEILGVTQPPGKCATTEGGILQ